MTLKYTQLSTKAVHVWFCFGFPQDEQLGWCPYCYQVVNCTDCLQLSGLIQFGTEMWTRQKLKFDAHLSKTAVCMQAGKLQRSMS